MTMSFNINKILLVPLTGTLLLVGASSSQAEPGYKAIAENYANIAHANFEDALTTASALKKAVTALIAAPSKDTLNAAKTAWKSARIPYQQTEAFRFGNKLVDDWEGKVNAWPLDEGLIDYVSKDYGSTNEENPYYTANIIANKNLKISGKDVDTTHITPALLESLQETGGVEANVATGYHAIEFLLWGQDLNGTNAGAGTRPSSDYDVKNCTGGNCERRADYLRAATDLLIKDLKDMVALWDKKGKARATVLKNDGANAIQALLTGMGSLSFGELAGDRIKLGLMLHDPEEEHDCFSDNTHASHFNSGLGIINIYTGQYKRMDGSLVKGASLADFMAQKDKTLNTALLSKLQATKAAMSVMVKRAEGGEAYDQMIGSGNKVGNSIIQNVADKLTAQTKDIERVLAVLNIKGVEMRKSDDK